MVKVALYITFRDLFMIDAIGEEREQGRNGDVVGFRPSLTINYNGLNNPLIMGAPVAAELNTVLWFHHSISPDSQHQT